MTEFVLQPAVVEVAKAEYAPSEGASELAEATRTWYGARGRPANVGVLESVHEVAG